MDTTNLKLMKKISFAANSFLTACVIGMLFIYISFNVKLMVYLSIPVLVLYGLFFVLIAHNRIDYYFWAVYATIGIYMCAATICLGINYGFNLYCMSLVPIGFFCQYLAHRLKAKFFKTGNSSVVLIAIYFLSVGIVFFNGPLYVLDKKAEIIFYILNSFFVFVFLVAYSGFLVNLVIDSEKKLENMALYDNLTGLYNRHCIMDKLVELKNQKTINWISIVDIDKFKSINDTYGHAAGDEILKSISKVMRDTCSDCYISRWGGEEFLIVPFKENVSGDILEVLRQKIEAHEFSFEDRKISVTISAGAAKYSLNSDLERCIQAADKCLYNSKNDGRNKITWDMRTTEDTK